MQDVVEVIFHSLLKEIIAAEKKHPAWPDDPIHAAAILAEESGELTQAAIDFYYSGGDRNRMIDEAVQCGAMVIRFLMNSNQYKRNEGANI